MDQRVMLTVSQLNDYVKSLIDSSTFLSHVYVKGEISNFTNHYKTGHFYFSLKDEKSLLKAVMFQSYASRIKFVPENNMQVLVGGRISVFPRDGVYQLYAETMEPLGKGALYAAFEQMKARLESEGYFKPEHKKSIPRYPKRIGIVTSPIGAAVADMKNIISRRYPIAEIHIYPALVQGEGAAADLCEGIKYFDGDEDTDVIIIGRGGGSIEDLWAFNDEVLAKTIYNCKTPVISAVGHETDYTICDFVSDLRAPTPSAAAELAVPDKSDILFYLSGIGSHLTSLVSGMTAAKSAELEGIADKKCFKSPSFMTDRLSEELASLDRRISQSTGHIVSMSGESLRGVSARLAALNPMNVLARGYAAVFDKDGKVISSVKAVKSDDDISLRLADGEIKAKVI